MYYRLKAFSTKELIRYVFLGCYYISKKEDKPYAGFAGAALGTFLGVFFKGLLPLVFAVYFVANLFYTYAVLQEELGPSFLFELTALQKCIFIAAHLLMVALVLVQIWIFS